ncbi:uncharacterized protein LOC122076253 [Macadamia integrifolia]|uniref:uncharacterized protein LOC122076253 n=1 Tax=Macadamia integrifolia TaxID=60698 RepID=UPI001C4F3BBF|nr:uncharacterized protein LOC122076253 [Macadamia integrifolia]
MVSDEFSFPTITEPIPRFADSPSLWNVSYEVFSDHDSSYGITTRDQREEEEYHRRKSFPMAINREKMKSAKDGGISKEDEERMDMLWENFNDEIRRISSLDKSKEDRRLRRKGGGDSGVDGDQEAELYCVKAWKMTKTSSSAIFSPRKPSLFSMVKVVKKMLLLHNSHCPKKSSTTS